MGIQAMNHFNVLTDDVEKTRRFYVDIVGSRRATPSAGIRGAWFYAGGRAILHVSGAKKLPAARVSSITWRSARAT
jgi:catechol 2,3-dioxygenase-like lactoylglutathione lyase family enzyme